MKTTPRPLLLALALPCTLVALLALAHAAPTVEATCPPPVERPTSDAPIYVVLYGYPHLPGAPDRSLKQIGRDLLLMSSFFDALGPRKIWVHGERDPILTAKYDRTLRAPDWRSLKRTVDELRAALDTAEPGAQVYLYFAGHGEQRGRDDSLGGVLFGIPEPRADGPGYDGQIDGGLLAREVLRPLGKRARVHLLVDACGSFYLLTARGGSLVERTPKAPPRVFTESFARALPGVGAILATEDRTYETASVGGIFSHTLRTAAQGAADLDRDGVITYGELHYTLMQLLAGSRAMARPTIVPPGLDGGAPFIDWRRSPAARVCVPNEADGRPGHLADTTGISASVIPSDRATLWLRDGGTYTFIDAQGQGRSFIARDGPLVTDDAPSNPGASRPRFRILDRPINLSATEPPPLPAVPPFVAPWYLGLAATGVVGDFLGALGGDLTVAALGSVRLGRGYNRLAVEGGWAGIEAEWLAVTGLGPRRRRASVDAAIGRFGYDRLVSTGRYEISVAALLGAVHVIDGESDTTAEGTLRLTLLTPWSPLPTLSGRFDARLSVLPAPSGVETMLQLGVGLDFEMGLD